MKTREEAFALLNEWVSSESLRNHCSAVACAMEEYASKAGLSDEEKDKWFICGLLHDFDYEKYPDIDVHPIKGCQELREEGYDEDIIAAILGHNEKTGIKRYDSMAKTLFAVDELSGLIMALARVRPDRFGGMTAESVEKALKKKDFAKNISRADIELGINELGVERKDHFETVIGALRKNSGKIGF
jgi:putative nucleotidyltransferase with HDIG domain